MSAPWTIVGQGLAGTCLAWELWHRGVEFRIIDRERGGSSRVAAGLINPVTGKNFEPTPRVAEFLAEALVFYQTIANLLEGEYWHPLPILRLAADDREWNKMLAKRERPDVACWLANHGAPHAIDGWLGALEVAGGGRIDTRAFLDASRDFFRGRGIYQMEEITRSGDTRLIWCDGAAGLIGGRCGSHRCAKGEILTLHASGWSESHIRIGAGGWLVPLGNHRFKAGSTYEWDRLDEKPTGEGREKVMAIARRLGGNADIGILAHEAGVRPILRRSEPMIGPLDMGGWMFNGLGSKGSLLAPGMARRLAEWICQGIGPEVGMRYRHQRH
ncbi:MAG: FAD-binding oxidoreductase [Akkermansiaceae bacterium]|nr:FAD-binding oxidoreductase [Akkermansiaceae bacterium]